ncbi:MAG TPA: ThuA domain-containing protein [Phycisphaerae bacterium]|nr:ThuA domain-containing protein [Phycisphaerae bacterium]
MRQTTKMAVALVVVMAVVVGAACVVSAEEATAPKIRIFMLQGGGHDWKNHLPMLGEILTKTGDFDVTISDDMDQLKAENITKYTVVLFYGSGLNFKSPEQEKGLCDFVRSGGAFVGIHSATDSFKKSDAYWELVGGRFAGHGGGKFMVRIEDKNHPITKGLEDFEIQDETYRHKYHEKAKRHDLIRMDRGKEQQSMAWVRDYGKGRVFYTSLGHGREAWTNPHFQRLAVRGIYWAVGRDPKDP